MSEPSSSTAAPRKRRRPALSCEQCRRRKIKCDRSYPCGQCLQSKTASCSYSPDAVRASRHVSHNTSNPTPSSSVGVPNRPRGIPDLESGTTGYPSSDGISPDAVTQSEATLPSSWTSPSAGLNDEEAPDPKALLTRIKRVEQELASGCTSFAYGVFEGYKSHTLAKELRGTVSKTRFFGPSHWMYSYGTVSSALIPRKFLANLIQFDKIALLSLDLCNDTPTLSGDLETSAIGRHIRQLTEKCKSLAKAAKAVPYCQWLANPNFRDAVPTRDMADSLVNLYFRTQESLYRILHIPSFQKEYEQYWQQPSAANPIFILKLLLVMSIGACFYQGPDAYLYRSEATKWIFAAQAWFSSPFEKGRLHMSAIQLQCLLLLARQHHSIAGDLVWISAGALLRTSLQMGYHRDPKVLPKMSAMQAEIRRRLWATILEINIQSAVDSGMPLLISAEDFDTEPPGNIDDVNIDETMLSPVEPKPRTTFTQCSIQIALLKAFLTRLEVVRFSNNIRFEPSYDEVLRVGSELSKACRENDAFFSKVNQSSATDAKASQLHRNLLDSSIRRFLLLVHRPFAAKGLNDPHYYFSRKVCLDSAVHMLRYPCSDYPTPEQQIIDNGVRDDFAQLKTVSGSFFKSFTVHAAMMIFAELYTQLDEDPMFSEHSRTSRDALKKCLRDLIQLAADRISAVENNVKGHLFMSVVLAQLEAMESGENPEKSVLEAASKSADKCYEMLSGRISAGMNAPVSVDNGPMVDIPGLEGAQDFGMDFTMQDWSLDQENPDSWFKSGFEDGVWWHC
jgi:hypothetical protein